MPVEEIENDRSSKDIKQCLTFLLDSKEYAIDILEIQEIRVWEQATIDLSDAPDYVMGAIDLRGVKIPLVDMRKRFHLDDRDYNEEDTDIIIIKEEWSEGNRVGLIVDFAADVFDVTAEQIRPAENFGRKTLDCMSCFVLEKSSVIVILDTKRILEEEVAELMSIEEAEEAEEAEESDIEE